MGAMLPADELRHEEVMESIVQKLVLRSKRSENKCKTRSYTTKGYNKPSLKRNESEETRKSRFEDVEKIGMTKYVCESMSLRIMGSD
jgi:hypothetical protein